MIEDWFETLELPMDIATWRRLPRNAAYKFEYWDGRAVISPRPNCCHAVLDLKTFRRKSQNKELAIRPMTEGDWDGLAKLMSASFAQVPPFTALDDQKSLAAANDCLASTRSGKDGALLEAANRVAYEVTEDGTQRLLGAVLVTLVQSRATRDEALVPHLTWIFVSQWQARAGIGSTLLGRVVETLLSLGFAKLESTILVANHASMMWHWRMGFELIGRYARFRGESPESAQDVSE